LKGISLSTVNMRTFTDIRNLSLYLVLYVISDRRARQCGFFWQTS